MRRCCRSRPESHNSVGNRVSLTVNGATTTNTFDDANRLTASGTTTYGYDNNGNLTSKTAGGATTTYGYDSLNRLTSVTGGISYTYNGDGLRTRKTVGSTTTDFTWDPTGLGTVIADGDRYVWGLGLIGRVSGNTRTYAHQDGLGSTRLVTSSNGNVAGTTAYDAFGTTRTSSGTQYYFGFTGEQFDSETGFVYLRARYYDPGQGRFISKDPRLGIKSNPSTLHPYAYVNNTPTALTDPSGMSWWDDLEIFVEWVFEAGDERRYYGQNDRRTKDMMKSEAAKQMREDFLNGGCQDGKGNWSTMAAAHELYGNPTNATQAQVGGFVYSYHNNGDGTATFRIENTLSMESFFYHARPFSRPDRDGWLPFMGNVYQVFEWQECVSACP